MAEIIVEGQWSGKRDLNPRPSAWEADALPAELFPPYGYYINWCWIFFQEFMKES